jgi:hypothetical protein
MAAIIVFVIVIAVFRILRRRRQSKISFDVSRSETIEMHSVQGKHVVFAYQITPFRPIEAKVSGM